MSIFPTIRKSPDKGSCKNKSKQNKKSRSGSSQCLDGGVSFRLFILTQNDFIFAQSASSRNMFFVSADGFSDCLRQSVFLSFDGENEKDGETRKAPRRNHFYLKSLKRSSIAFFRASFILFSIIEKINASN